MLVPLLARPISSTLKQATQANLNLRAALHALSDLQASGLDAGVRQGCAGCQASSLSPPHAPESLLPASTREQHSFWHGLEHNAVSTLLGLGSRSPAPLPPRLPSLLHNNASGQSYQQHRHFHHSTRCLDQQDQQPGSTSAGVQGAQVQPQEQAQQSPPRPPLVMRVFPDWAHPYAQLMRLDKPIGTWLLMWPGLWSIAMAAEPGHWPDLWMITLFTLGSVLLRGSGCTINDLWDRDLDRRVARTRSRPLASGAVSTPQAIGLLAAQLSLGLVILLQLNDYSKILGASSLLLVGSYPLMKRITHWPQAYLGLTINWGALLGWSAVRGSCDWSVVLPLYLSGACWSLIYDTIYAHQDKSDDAKAGMGSTALLFGQKTDLVLLGFATTQVALLTLAGGSAGMSWPYYAGVTALASHLVWQIRTVDLNNGKDCMDTFVCNKWAGAILFAGCVSGRLAA